MKKQDKTDELKKRVGQMLEPAWLYANLPMKSDNPLMELADIVQKFNCHGGVVHPGDVWNINLPKNRSLANLEMGTFFDLCVNIYVCFLP